MRRGVTAIVLALAVLVACVILLVQRATPTVEPSASAPRALHGGEVTALTAQLEASESVSPESTANADTANADAASAETPTPERAALAPRLATESDGPLIRVVSRKQRTPIAHATVYWLETDDRAATAALLVLGPEHAAGPWPRGTRVFHADAAGRVQLPRSRHAVRMVGFAPQFSGSLELIADWRSELTLRLDETIYARVVTQSGEPAADVPVSVARAGARAVSDAEGRVRLVLSKRDEREPPDPDHLLRAEPWNLVRVELRVPSAATLDQRWTLRLPATGSLNVHLVDAEAVLGRVRGNLTVSALDGSEQNPELSVQAPFLDENARVRGLRAGCEHKIDVSCENLVFGPSFRVGGPSFDGEVIVHEVRLADATIIALRVLGPQGDVWSESYVHVQLAGMGELELDGAATTSAGRLYVFLAAQSVAGAPRSLTIRTADTEPVELDISSARPRGVTSFGDVTLGQAVPGRVKSTPFGGRKLGGKK